MRRSAFKIPHCSCPVTMLKGVSLAESEPRAGNLSRVPRAGAKLARFVVCSDAQS